MHKTVNGKQFDLGALYVSPWRLTSRTSYEEPEITIPDGSLVVILDIEECSSSLRFSDYKLRVLTTEGEIADIYSTVAGLDYWKLAKNRKKK